MTPRRDPPGESGGAAMRRREQFLKQRGLTPDPEGETRAEGDAAGDQPDPPAEPTPSEEGT